MKSIKKYSIYRRDHSTVEDGRWVSKTEKIKIEVMATSGIWAMVRRKGCAPFIVEIGLLEDL